jgi:hypothetical protein
MISEIWVRIGVEGSGRGLISVASLYLSRRAEENQEETFLSR